MKKLPRIEKTCMECGALVVTTQARIDDGRGKFCSKSCGIRFNGRSHGHTTHSGQSKTYNTWTNMISRCYRKSAPRYPAYGGKGISVCQEWKTSFAAFLADMGERPDGSTIDRIDSTGNYEKMNCRWASIGDQQRNRKNNVNITIHGITKCLEDWSESSGIHKSTIAYRFSSGWSEDDLLRPTLVR